MKHLILFAVFLALAPICNGQPTVNLITDGNSLSRGIKLINRLDEGNPTPDDAAGGFYALGYLAGFLDGSWKSWHPDSPFKLPQGHFSVNQLIAVVDKYLANHPEQLHESASLLVFRALIESFPNPNHMPTK